MKPRGLEPSQFSLAVGDTGCCRPCWRPEVVLDAVDMRREALTQQSEMRVNEVFTGRVTENGEEATSALLPG